jgi:phage shock protein A
MTDNVEHLILEHLRALRADVAEVKEKLDLLTTRVNAVERTVANLTIQMAEFSGRMDSFDRRLTRIERRLDLVNERA